MGKSPKKAKATGGEAVEEAAVDPHRARLDKAMEALAPGEVVKAPSHAKARAEHVETIAAAATADAAKLLSVPLEGGAIEPWELDVFPVAAAYAKDLGDAVSADRLAAGAPLSAKDTKLLGEVRTDQAKLLSAFRRLRFKSDRTKLRELRAIEVGDHDDVIDAYGDSTALLALANHENHKAWVATLPLGESEAVARLSAAQARLGALAKAAKLPQGAAARREAQKRVWTVITRIERKVRDAADYLFHKQSRREAYVAFVAPKSRKPKKKKTG